MCNGISISYSTEFKGERDDLHDHLDVFGRYRGLYRNFTASILGKVLVKHHHCLPGTIISSKAAFGFYL